ncbi:hypothetical protein ACFOX0_22075 [Micromonospora zhanjiangensis]|uniref:Uncharacterized protein n=1 Tax=Micromonospora zhanjiangensis TaxID=1522057 RepID=A0ABV8KR61_9ACTN
MADKHPVQNPSGSHARRPPLAHDLTHLAQVGEVLARRYRDDVGPYRRFMPALDRIAEAE